MPSTVKLQNGDVFEADVDPQALAETFDAAREDGTLVKVGVVDAGYVWINPHALATITPPPAAKARARCIDLTAALAAAD
jgi:hypothetical protein